MTSSPACKTSQSAIVTEVATETGTLAGTQAHKWKTPIMRTIRPASLETTRSSNRFQILPWCRTKTTRPRNKTWWAPSSIRWLIRTYQVKAISANHVIIKLSKLPSQRRHRRKCKALSSCRSSWPWRTKSPHWSKTSYLTKRKKKT